MAEDQDRAARIKELKRQNPQLTWAKIAEETGVKERSAIKWQTTGALKTDNAVALARLFGVDFDYIWWGPRPDTPELFVDRRNKPAGPVAVHELTGPVEERMSRIEQTLATIIANLEAAHDDRTVLAGMLDTNRVLLERQDAVLEQIGALLERQDRILEQIVGATELADDAADRLGVAVREAEAALRSGPRSPAPKAPKTPARNSRQASAPDRP